MAAVCPSIRGTSTGFVTPYYGYAAMGEVSIPGNLIKFDDMSSTKKVVEEMDAQALFRSYAVMKPADVFLSVGSENIGAHCMMCYKEAEVVYRADGSIDPEESQAVIIDQWSSEHKFEINGNRYSIRGRIDKKYTFSELKRLHFIPLRASEFADWKGYTPASSALNREVKSLSDLRNARVESNYRVAYVELLIRSESGTVVLRKHYKTPQSMYPNSEDRNIPGSEVVPMNSEVREVVREGRAYTVEVRSLLATGESFLLAEFPIDPADFK